MWLPVVGAALAISACAGPQVAGDATGCKAGAISDAVTTAIAPDDVLIRLDGFACSGAFAYAFATTGPADGNPDGEIGVTLVLKSDGSTWSVQDRDAVCGTAQITDGPAPYPADAQVPEAIWQNACQTN